MAHNVSQDEELLGILRDVAENRFRQARQINPNSMLFQTASLAVTQHYIQDAVIDATYNHTLASFDFTKASLTPTGEEKIADLQSAAERNS